VNAEIVGVGTELLLGQIANDNARYISERLADVGVDVLYHTAVGDNLERIADVFRLALSRADVLIVTGGLGPTQDDITREGLSEAIGVRLVREPAIEAFLRERFAGRGREMPETNLQQADVPEGGRYVLSERGTAPGLAVDAPGGKRVYLMAGVPSEMREMMDRLVVPELRELAGPAVIVSRVLKVAGVSESLIAQMLDDVFHGSTNPSLAYLAGGGEVKVRVTAKASTAAQAQALIEPIAQEVERRLGDYLYSEEGEDLEAVVGRLLTESGRSVACAESLTGGSLGVRLSASPGSSDFFLGSAVCYTAAAKHAVLGVRQETIDGPGVVSEECAMEMARGARRLYDADVALSVTGVAGPDEHGGRPRGTICLGLAAEGVDVARTLRAPGDRAQVRRWAEQAALDVLRRHLEGAPIPEQLGPSTRVREGGVEVPATSTPAGS
jgi:nicotinamide-nucleotide amidase